ncbi:MAG TPA: PTS sugar transporter subunit IIA [Candidatus Anaerostipes avicola]|nr:PTS sugar transporter subunit IIA [uncultured Anaerostipes sp.]HJC83112.1 PTS sugar transporter subunit IIA [Candidatus Anaerostipes avicola]
MDLLKQENVQIIDQVSDWKEAIRQSVAPLEKGGYVQSCYKEEIIKNADELGPYFVISEKIAIPHARPEQGVNESQLAITLYKEPIVFSEKWKNVRLFIALAAKDGNSHLDALRKITEVLQNPETIQKIIEANTEEKIYEYFQ